MESQDIEKQVQELDEWIKSNLDSRELKRALGVKLALQGWTYRAIGEVLNLSTSFISKWKKQFKSAGIEGLKLAYKGARSKKLFNITAKTRSSDLVESAKILGFV